LGIDAWGLGWMIDASAIVYIFDDQITSHV